ncbi:glycosyl hydrolase family 28-related protein [Geodermatophilus ruber]|uniref:Right handed beta helix region n=1 Tax=Geodermatophilus ruber TaxID=504800 RepID=A0A1I4BRK8_9ACTN|nr:glycosyl hydrolase family 28-related protein [Geodermatophilus ruber]SFK70616.1 Right handed beta helix region [Geodermatophilus ruber]
MSDRSPSPGRAARRLPGGPALSRRNLFFLGATGLAAVPLFGAGGLTPASPAGGLRPLGAENDVLDLRDFGAKGDGVRDDTRAVQRLIDASARRGQVGLVPRGTYRITASLLVPAGARLSLNRGARLLKDWAAPVGLQDALLRNADLSQPISGVQITGPGTIGARDHSRTGVVIGLYGHDVLLRGFTIDTYAGGQAIMYAGDRGRVDQVTIRNSAEETGTGGIRVFGGNDFLGTDCHVESGDDCFQFVPIGNPQAEPSLYNQSIARGRFVGCTGTSTVSRFMVALLEFTGGEPGTTDMDASVTDCSFEQCSGRATNRGIVVKNSHSTGSIERLAFTDCTVDMARAADASAQEIRIQTDATTGGAIRGVTFTRTNITNPVNSTLRVGGPHISGLTFDTCDFVAPSGAAPLVAVVDAASDVTFRGCSFSGTQESGTGAGASKRVLVAGPTAPVTGLVVERSRFTGIGNTFFGVDVLSATGATITGSTFTALAGAATARAVRVSPEATNVVIEGNDFTGIAHAAPVADRGVGTVVAANTGA